ncbi:MAG: hypothetical protein J3K34DRAFT_425982, partial [Monoraphidium minutum]
MGPWQLPTKLSRLPGWHALSWPGTPPPPLPRAAAARRGGAAICWSALEAGPMHPHRTTPARPRAAPAPGAVRRAHPPRPCAARDKAWSRFHVPGGAPHPLRPGRRPLSMFSAVRRRASQHGPLACAPPRAAPRRGPRRAAISPPHDSLPPKPLPPAAAATPDLPIPSLASLPWLPRLPRLPAPWLGRGSRAALRCCSPPLVSRLGSLSMTGLTQRALVRRASAGWARRRIAAPLGRRPFVSSHATQPLSRPAGPPPVWSNPRCSDARALLRPLRVINSD